MQLATVRSRRRGRRVWLMDLADSRACGAPATSPQKLWRIQRKTVARSTATLESGSAAEHEAFSSIPSLSPRGFACIYPVRRRFERFKRVFQPPATRYAPTCLPERRCSCFPGWRTRPTSRSRTGAICSPLRQPRIDKQSRQRTVRRGRIGFASPSIASSQCEHRCNRQPDNRRHRCARAHRRCRPLHWAHRLFVQRIRAPRRDDRQQCDDWRFRVGDRRTNRNPTRRRRPDHAPAGRRNRAGPIAVQPLRALLQCRRYHRVGSGDHSSLVDRPYTDAARALGYRRAAKPDLR